MAVRQVDWVLVSPPRRERLNNPFGEPWELASRSGGRGDRPLRPEAALAFVSGARGDRPVPCLWGCLGKGGGQGG